MSNEFQRQPEAGRMIFGGIKLNVLPDLIPPGKFASAVNIRGTRDGSVRTRPGQVLKFSTAAVAITDLAAYSALSTDNLPRYLARGADDRIWLDNGVQVGTLAGAGASPGCTMLPFRPAQSPQPWIYAANGNDYQKFSAPAPTVVARKVGIAEPQSAPDAVPDQFNVTAFNGVAANWAAAGTAGALSDVSRVADTTGAIFADPASLSPPGLSVRYSVQVSTSKAYQVGQVINIANSAGGTVPMIVQDVIPPVAANSSLSIQAIQYFTGSTGRCMIVPSQMPVDNSVPEFQGLNPIGDSINNQAQLASLWRGSIVLLSTGGNTEKVFVLSVTHGPQGLVTFECVTVNTHVAGELILGFPTISVSFTQPQANLTGQAITASAIQSSVAVGIGTISSTAVVATNPFATQPFVGNPTLPTSQQDDYVHLSVLVSDLTLLTSIRLLFDVGDGSFAQNYFYFDVQPSALTAAVAGTQTQLGASQTAAQQAASRRALSGNVDQAVGFTRNPLGANLPSGGDPGGSNIIPSDISTLGVSQWTEIMFPIRDFTRVGNDQSKTLANCNAVRVQVTATATITFQYSSIWVGAGGQPDVGDVGSLYFYRIRPRDSRTGAVGNPSPSTRYGISPRRQQVVVPLPSAAYDSQIDTWDIFRYGGSVTSWRYIGSTASSATAYIDNVFDSEAQAGEALDFDNFEPWPSVDLPQNLTATAVTGTVALVTISAPTNALRWLPGTQVQLAAGQVFTLRIRPVLISGTTYRLEFLETAQPGSNVAVSIPEPLLANQPLPYMWGPDEAGTIFACGDPLRPGTLYFSKNYAPDSAPDTYNMEISPPNEPLLGGEIVDGLSMVGSPERAWALYPQPDNPAQRYAKVQQPSSRGFAAPWGHCTDGKQVWWWAKDGIRSAQESLTDADLYNLFPHDGVVGSAVTYGAVTYQPPDYSRAGKFRLTHVNGHLYAIYQDSGGVYRCLVLSLRSGAWHYDTYTPAVSAILHPSNQAGTLLASTTRYDEMLMGNLLGQVATQTELTNDLGGPIACTIAPNEFDGGDVRAPVQWGDYFVDVTPAAVAGVVCQPVSQGIAVCSPSTIPTSVVRQRSPLSVGGIVVSEFLGIHITWSDDFSSQSVRTEVHIWQASWDLQPARTLAFQTFGSSFGIDGFMHIPEVTIAYVSTAPITLNILTVDGLSPAAITLPSTSGVYAKVFFRPTPNKGRLYNFQFTSAAKFQIFLDDCEVKVGAWGRASAYQTFKSLGERNVETAAI